MLCEYQLSLPFQSIDTAEPAEKVVLEKALAQVGFIPNMYAAMVNSPGLLNTYLEGYASFRADSGFTPPEQEVVFLAISHENGCDYCLAAHSMLADKASNLDPAVTDAIRADLPVKDAKLAALARFTKIMLRSRGLPTQAEVETFLASGYGERQVLEIVLAIAVKTLSNYSNHLFHTPVDEMFAYRSV